jgi:hypothetical protein
MQGTKEAAYKLCHITANTYNFESHPSLHPMQHRIPCEAADL